jgi:hypothetical protein
MLAVVLVYVGILIALAGFISLVKPVRIFGMRTRRRAGLVLAMGLLVLFAGTVFPARLTRVTAAQTHLDEFVPLYQFHEVHSVPVAASRERVYQAIKSVTAKEILFFRTLTWVRRLGRPGPEGILNTPEQQPLLEVATRTSFLLLAEEPNREIVVGTLVLAPPGWQPRSQPTPEDFKAVQAPGFALAAMNFRVEEIGPNACQVTTETRVFATDASAGRTFARYWRVIYPGSALIRRMWLRAIQQRAEAAPR